MRWKPMFDAAGKTEAVSRGMQPKDVANFDKAQREPELMKARGGNSILARPAREKVAPS